MWKGCAHRMRIEGIPKKILAKELERRRPQTERKDIINDSQHKYWQKQENVFDKATGDEE